MRRLFVLGLLLLGVRSACADGGRLRLHEPAGPFVVTLFTSPDPLTEGQADFSVAVERRETQGLVQDATVTLILTPVDGKEDHLVLRASHDAATSRFLQAANFSLPRSGVWRIAVIVQQGADVGRCSGQIEVLPRKLITDQIAWEIAGVPIILSLFAIHRRRKMKYRKGLNIRKE